MMEKTGSINEEHFEANSIEKGRKLKKAIKTIGGEMSDPLRCLVILNYLDK